jgi:hypothetical protein
MHENGCGSPRLRTLYALAGVDQRYAGTVDTGNRVHRELRHVAEQVDDASGAGHDPSYPAKRDIQLGLVRFDLRSGQFSMLWRLATRLGVVVSHGAHNLLDAKRMRAGQLTSANA